MYYLAVVVLISLMHSSGFANTECGVKTGKSLVLDDSRSVILTKLVGEAYRFVLKGVEYDLNIAGFGKTGEGYAEVDKVFLNSDSEKVAVAHKDLLPSILINRLKISKDKKQLTLKGSDREMGFEITLSLKKVFTGANPEIERLRIDTAD